MAIYDLHSHTVCSDGTLTPSDLVARARTNGVDVLALTDHDATDGLAEAKAAAADCGMRLVPGVEISVTWQRQTLHIVGLCIDPANAILQQGLARLRDLRHSRAEEIGRRLRKKNILDAYDRARDFAGGSVISRTHFARYLVSEGLVGSMGQAFKQYLGRGRVAHVPGEWATLEEAVAWIRAAGGVAVIAHPARYPLSAGKLKRLLQEFRDCGGLGIEVLSGVHSSAEAAAIGRLASECGLLGSVGSDFHGPDKPWIDVGRLPTLAVGITPVWSVFESQNAVP